MPKIYIKNGKPAAFLLVENGKPEKGRIYHWWDIEKMEAQVIEIGFST